MGLFDVVKGVFRKRVPETPEHKEYRECLDTNLKDIQRFKGYIAQYSNQVEAHRRQGDYSSPAYSYALDYLNRFKYSLFEAEKTTKFIRENRAEDVAYRTDVLPHFAENLAKILPSVSPLRFHGTPIYFAEEILKSGTLSSSAERFDGYVRSTDQQGQISVSDINSLARTVDWFLDVKAYQRCLPCGCLFVMDGYDQTDEQKAASIMNSIDFRRDPGRLCAVVSTPENVESIKGWLVKAGLSPDLAHTFDGYLLHMEKSLVASENKKSPLSERIASADNVATTMNTQARGYSQNLNGYGR